MGQVGALTASVQALSVTVEGLVTSVDADRKASEEAKKAADRATHRSTIKIRWLMLLTALDIIISVAMVSGFFRISHVADCQSQVSAEVRSGTEEKTRAADRVTDAQIAGLDEFTAFLHAVQQRDMPQAVRDVAYAREYASLAAQRAWLMAQKRARAANPPPADRC